MTVPAGCVFLLTDYGYGDELAGVLRAAVVSAAPAAPVVDLTHGIAPFDVVGGARALARCVPHLGPGVVVGVVDPGVGTSRRAVAVEVDASPRYLVGPDNGLLMEGATTLGGPRRAVALRRSDLVTVRTFDGRDVFAPVAAALWAGADLADVGCAIDVDGLVGLPDPVLQVGRGELRAEVTWVDRFGNVQLAACPSDAEAAGLGADGAAVTVVIGGTREQAIRVASFAGAGSGLGLLVDANGRLALVLDRSSAAQLLDVRVGDLVDLLGNSG
ncbi:MAG: SAM-dependent chlorinase/fluorinase [Actinomycetota bacterium]|nr:SAM-dependent chlorinase/fluorinase [Actinomycetota bacterium]